MSDGKMSDGLSTSPVDDGQTSDFFQHRKISDGLSTILYYKLLQTDIRLFSTPKNIGWSLHHIVLQINTCVLQTAFKTVLRYIFASHTNDADKKNTKLCCQRKTTVTCSYYLCRFAKTTTSDNLQVQSNSELACKKPADRLTATFMFIHFEHLRFNMTYIFCAYNAKRELNI
jgi:hypothetical protein